MICSDQLVETHQLIRQQVIHELSMDWKGLSEMEREEYLPDGKNDKKRSFESFTSRERVWSAKRFSVWKSLKETVKSIIYSSLIIRWSYLIMFMRPLYSCFIARRKLGSCKYIILVLRRKRIQCQNMSNILGVIFLVSVVDYADNPECDPRKLSPHRGWWVQTTVIDPGADGIYSTQLLFDRKARKKLLLTCFARNFRNCY